MFLLTISFPLAPMADDTDGAIDLDALARGIAAARVDEPPEPVCLSVTAYVDQFGAAARYRAEFDNTCVREGADITFGILRRERVVLPRLGGGFGSPAHDVYMRALVAIAGAGMEVYSAEQDLAPLEWVAPTTRAPVRLTGRLDMLARDAATHREMVVELKTSGSTEDETACWRDLCRRSYIQQAQLYALARFRATGRAPLAVWIVGIPSDMVHQRNPLHACRVCVRYDPVLWLRDINHLLGDLQRYTGEPALPCDTSLFAGLPDEWFDNVK